MTSRKTHFIDCISKLTQSQQLQYIQDNFPRYTPTQIKRSSLEEYSLLREKTILAAIGQGILRDDYTVGWSDAALLNYVKAHYKNMPLKRVRKDEPLLVDALQQRSLLISLIEEGILVGNRPTHFFETMGEKGREQYVLTHFNGVSSSQLRESNQTLYNALGKKEREALIKKGILVCKSGAGKNHVPKSMNKMSVHRALASAPLFDEAGAYPVRLQVYFDESSNFPKENIWPALRTIYSVHSSTGNSKTTHHSLDERIE